MSDLVCEHKNVIPEFDEDDARDLSPIEVRKKYPRFFGTCPDCGSNVIAYASFEHFIAGDW